jgi:hypothetical protein
MSDLMTPAIQSNEDPYSGPRTIHYVSQLRKLNLLTWEVLQVSAGPFENHTKKPTLLEGNFWCIDWGMDSFYGSNPAAC